jgi:hypothetical protein
MDMWSMFRVVGGGGVNQVDLQVGGTGASIDETICDSAGLDPNGGCLGVELGNLSLSSGQPRLWVSLPEHSGAIWVFKDIYLTGQTGHLTQFSESFHVPEPLTLTLIGSGLLGFGLLRRRLKK